MSDDSRFYVMFLDDFHLADLLHDISEMIRGPIRNSPVMHDLVGIVDEDDGGIIAYAIGEANGLRIKVALEDIEGPRGVNG